MVDVNEAFHQPRDRGQPVDATLNAYPDWKIPGSVIAIIPTADRSKATVKVRIAIRSKDPRIVPDMGVRVGFLGAPSAAPAPAVASGVLVPPMRCGATAPSSCTPAARSSAAASPRGCRGRCRAHLDRLTAAAIRSW